MKGMDAKYEPFFFFCHDMFLPVTIRIYHYFGRSKICGIYNPVQVLVASYQVLIRLNFSTISLAFVMNTDYISYYFTPLVSMWYLVVYLTMVAGARFNDKGPLLLKIVLSAGMMTWFMNESWLLEMLFDIFCFFLPFGGHHESGHSELALTCGSYTWGC